MPEKDLTPEQLKQLETELTKYAEEGASDDELRQFRTEFTNQLSLKKKDQSSPASSTGKPSASPLPLPSPKAEFGYKTAVEAAAETTPLPKAEVAKTPPPVQPLGGDVPAYMNPFVDASKKAAMGTPVDPREESKDGSITEDNDNYYYKNAAYPKKEYTQYENNLYKKNQEGSYTNLADQTLQAFSDVLLRPVAGGVGVMRDLSNEIAKGLGMPKLPDVNDPNYKETWLSDPSGKFIKMVNGAADVYDLRGQQNQLPNTLPGQVTQEVIHATPLIMTMAATGGTAGAGELLPKGYQTTKEILTKSAFNPLTTFLATKEGLGTYGEKRHEGATPAQAFEEAIPATIGGAVSGATLGAQMGLAGRLTEVQLEELARRGLMVGGKLTQAGINALNVGNVFGGTSIANDLLSGNDINLEEATKQFMTGLAFEFPHVANGVWDIASEAHHNKKLDAGIENTIRNDNAWTNFFNAKPEVLNQATAMKDTHQDLMKKSIEYGLKAADSKDLAEKQANHVAQLTLQKLSDVKFITEAIVENREAVLKGIDEMDIPQKQKDAYKQKVEDVYDNNHPDMVKARQINVELKTMEEKAARMKESLQMQVEPMERIKAGDELQTYKERIKEKEEELRTYMNRRPARVKPVESLKPETPEPGSTVPQKRGKILSPTGHESLLGKDLQEIYGPKEALKKYEELKNDKDMGDLSNPIVEDFVAKDGPLNVLYGDPSAFGAQLAEGEPSWRIEGTKDFYINKDLRDFKLTHNHEKLLEVFKRKGVSEEILNEVAKQPFSRQEYERLMIYESIGQYNNQVHPRTSDKSNITDRALTQILKERKNGWALDVNGEPMIFMHAGGKGISRFRKPSDPDAVKADEKTGKEGIYFSRDLDQTKRPGFDKEGNPGPDKDIYYAFLKMRNPYEVGNPVHENQYKLKSSETISSEDRHALEKLGFDGVVWNTKDKPNHEVIVFEPDQIKTIETYSGEKPAENIASNGDTKTNVKDETKGTEGDQGEELLGGDEPTEPNEPPVSGGGTTPPPAKEEPAEEPKTERPTKELSKNFVEDETIRQEVRDAVSKDDNAMHYDAIPNDVTQTEARKIVDAFGLDKAIDAFKDTSSAMPLEVRAVLGFEIMDRLDPESQVDLIVDMETRVSDLASEAGRYLQSFKIWYKTHPKAAAIYAERQMKKQQEAFKKAHKPTTDKMSEDLRDANDQAAQEVLENMGYAEKMSPEEMRRAKALEKSIADKLRKGAKAESDKAIRQINDVGKATGLWGKYKKYAANRLKRLTLSHIEGDVEATPILKEFTDGLIKNISDQINESAPEKEAKEPTKKESILIIADAYKNLEKYKEVWEKTQAELQDKYGKNSGKLEQLDDYFGDILPKPFSEKMLQRSVREEMDQQKVKIADVVKQHYSVQEKVKSDLATKLIQKADLENKDAIELAEAIDKEFTRLATDKKEQLLKKMFNDKQRKKPQIKSLEEKLVEMTNLGAFSNDAVMDLYAESMGMPKLTVENRAEIERLAQKVQEEPDGFRKHRAVQDLLAYQADLQASDWYELPMSVWYANILSGYDTQSTNMINGLTSAISLYSTMVMQNPSIWRFAGTALLKGIKNKGFIEAYETLRTGYSPIRAKVEAPTYLERKKFNYDVKGVNVIEALNGLKYVGRVMSAADVVWFEGLQELRAYEYAYRLAAKEGKDNPDINNINRALEILQDNDYTRQKAEDQADLEYNLDIAKGIDPKQAGRDRKRRVNELMEQARPVHISNEAKEYAAFGTLNRKPDGALGWLSNQMDYAKSQLKKTAANKEGNKLGRAGSNAAVAGLSLVVPFTRIIANYANMGLDYSPIGFARAATGKGNVFGESERYLKMNQSNKKQFRTEQYIKASIGTALMTSVLAFSQGDDDDPWKLMDITANGTGDYKKNEALKKTSKGWQPYSIRFKNPITGNWSSWFSYQPTPLIIGLGYIGNINDMKNYRGEDDETILMRSTMALRPAMRIMLDMTFLSSINNTLSSVMDPNNDEKGEDVKRSMLNMAKGFVIPNAYTQASRDVQSLFDIPQKEVKGTWFGSFVRDIPVARNAYNDQINYLGRPVITHSDKFVMTPIIDDDTKYWDLLVKLGANTNVPRRQDMKIITTASGKEMPYKKMLERFVTKDTERIYTEDEYYQFCLRRGDVIHKYLQQAYEGLVKLHPEDAKKQIESINSRATTIAQMELWNQ